MREDEHPDAFERHDVRHVVQAARADRRTIVPSLDADNLHRLARALAELGVEREELYPVSLERVTGLFDTVDGMVEIRPAEPGAFERHERRGSARTSARARQATEAAQDLCRRTFGEDARLVLTEPIVDEDGYRSCLVRCSIAGASDAPRTVVLKHANLDASFARAEASTLAFLRECGVTSMPRLYGFEESQGLSMLEDLGDVRELDAASILLRSDARAAVECLEALAEALGRLHGATAGRKGELPASDAPDHAADGLPSALGAFLETASLAGASPPAGAEQDVADAVAILARPGPFDVLTIGDICTKNMAMTDRGLRLFDLESGRFRHALVDGVFARIRWFHCLYPGRLPESVTERVEQVYRDALVQGCPAAGDGALYGRSLAAATAGWAASAALGLPDLLVQDRVRGGATDRQRLLACLEVLEATTTASGFLPALGEVAGILAGELRHRWAPSVRLPLHPAFIT